MQKFRTSVKWIRSNGIHAKQEPTLYLDYGNYRKVCTNLKVSKHLKNSVIAVSSNTIVPPKIELQL